jgi:ribosomal protein S12 methylthiotransferase
MSMLFWEVNFKAVNKLVHLISLGCAKNLVDSEILIGGLKETQLPITKDCNEAEIIIVNTCGFLDQAREESIEVILMAAELKKTGVLRELIVMGCLSERYPERLKKEIPEVDRFFGTNDHRQIISFLTGKTFASDDPLFKRSLLTPRHYAYLKIAEGCDNECSFCSIPQMRGLQKSRSVSAIMSEAENLVDSGVHELLVIAQDTTSYGWDLDEKICLHDLLKEMDKLGDPLKWIRLHYAHPAHLSSKMINDLSQFEKLCHYIDIPVQHSVNKILKSMRRGLNSEGIKGKIDDLRNKIPDIRIRTTLIVGYPGETDDDFNGLYDFVEEMQFDRLGIFTYSEEEGTIAANLIDDVHQSIKNDRKAILMDLQNEISANKNVEFEGQSIQVLIDELGDSVAIGRSEYDSPEIDNIVRVTGAKKVGIFEQVKITGSNAYELIGSVEHN